MTVQFCFKGPRVLETRWVRRFKFVHESPQFVMLSHKHRTLSNRHRSQVVLDSKKAPSVELSQD